MSHCVALQACGLRVQGCCGNCGGSIHRSAIRAGYAGAGQGVHDDRHRVERIALRIAGLESSQDLSGQAVAGVGRVVSRRSTGRARAGTGVGAGR